MVIVYLSIAVVIAAFIFLAIFGFRLSKQMQPTTRKVADTSGRLQQRVDDINKEKEKLTSRIEVIKNDVDYKKGAVKGVISQSKGTLEQLKDAGSFLRGLPNPRRVRRTEIGPEMHELVDHVIDLWEKIRYWNR